MPTLDLQNVERFGESGARIRVFFLSRHPDAATLVNREEVGMQSRTRSVINIVTGCGFPEVFWFGSDICAVERLRII